VTRLLVIGIGNPDCGDDAAGPMIARHLAGKSSTRASDFPPQVTIIERSGDMLGLVEEWVGHEGVVLIDAAAPVTAAGTIHRFDLLQDSLPAGLALASTHAFGVADAVGLARALDRLPARLVVYAVEGGTFQLGAPLTPAVAAVVDTVAEHVAEELHRLAAELT
jgi:hydrogenase maturation protease